MKGDLIMQMICWLMVVACAGFFTAHCYLTEDEMKAVEARHAELEALYQRCKNTVTLEKPLQAPEQAKPTAGQGNEKDSPDDKPVVTLYHEWECTTLEQRDELKKDKIMISLGCNCAAALALQHYNFSEAYFPFDWCKAAFKSVYLALFYDFKDYLLLPNLQLFSSDCGYHEVFDKQYGIEYVHDFTYTFPPRAGDLGDYGAVNTKYARRIKRLYKALNIGKEVLFFMTAPKKDEVLDLRKLISYKFPQLKYTLIALNNTPDYKEPWGEINIKNAFLENPIRSDRSELMWDSWDNALKELGLIGTLSCK